MIVADNQEWALRTPNERREKRIQSTSEELKEFHERILPYLEAVLEECDKYPFGELPASHHDLFNIALAAAEVAPHVELYRGDPRVPNSFEESQFVASHGTTEIWRGTAS